MAGNLTKVEAIEELARRGYRPRLLDLELAAAYVNLSAATFLEMVALGVYPQPLCDGRRKQWDVKALDLAIDRRSSLVASSHVDEVDQLTKAINAA